MTDTTITCSAFDGMLSDYLEGTLDRSAHLAMDAHAAACARCGALAADLRAIAHDARALPLLAPSRDLWAGIAERIEAPVVEMPARPAPAAHRRVSAARLAAAAAMLVAATATVTWWAASRALPNRAAVMAAHGDSLPIAAPGVATVSNTRTAEQVYDGEIARLDSVVRDRRGQLDPKTVAVIEHNLAIIDSAIASSRQALAKDPGSHFLYDQLNDALGQKVDLLRTAALLPSRS